MDKNNLNVEEEVSYEVIVKYDKQKFDTKLKITAKRIILEKLKGIFNKKFIIIDSIGIDDINMNKDKVKITNKKETIELETKKRNYKFICNNTIEAKKTTEKIIEFKTGTNIFDRTTKKVIKISKGVVKTAAKIGTTAVSVGVAVNAVNKNKDKVFKTVKAIKDIVIK